MSNISRQRAREVKARLTRGESREEIAAAIRLGHGQMREALRVAETLGLATCSGCQGDIIAPAVAETDRGLLCRACLGQSMDNFAALLRSARMLRDLSVERLAVLADVPKVTLIRYECGACTPPWPVAVRLLRTLNFRLTLAKAASTRHPAGSRPIRPK